MRNPFQQSDPVPARSRFTFRSACSFILLGGFIYLKLAGCGLQSPYYADSDPEIRVSSPSEEDIATSVFLIGDAGSPFLHKPEPNLETLRNEASRHPNKSVILFLGDNIYPSGLLPPLHPDRKTSERLLDAQIEVMTKSGAKGIFLPGNHDWDEMSNRGWESILRQAEYIKSKRDPRVDLLPRGGFPGPHVLDIGDRLCIILIDTQWWLHSGPKPLYPGTVSEVETKNQFLDSLSGLLNSADGRYTIVAAHHAIETYGEHGGFFDWRDHIFPLRKLWSWLWIPLPGVGSAYPLLRNHGISNQDLSGPAYQQLRRRLEQVFENGQLLAYAAGHEHSLQVLRSDRTYLHLVSGYGHSRHQAPLSDGPRTIFADSHPGFMRIDILLNGGVRLAVIEPINDAGSGREVFSRWLVPPH